MGRHKKKQAKIVKSLALANEARMTGVPVHYIDLEGEIQISFHLYS